MTAFRIRGRVVLTERQARELADGVKLFVPGDQLRKYIHTECDPGDLIWVQEPYHHCLPRDRWSTQTINTIIPGPRFGMKFPEWLRKLPHRTVYKTGERMPRDVSRATLVVEAMASERDGVWCVVRMEQVDKLTSPKPVEVPPCG